MRTAAQEGSAPKFIDSDGASTGQCPDIFAALEKADKALHFSVDPRPTPVKRIESQIKDGQERLVGRRDDNGVVRSVQDLAQAGDLVVTQSGASYAADLRRQGVQVMETPGGSVVALRNILNKRARFYYTNELTGAYYIRSQGMGEQLRLHPGVLQSSPSYLWASRNLDPSIVLRLEQAVAQLKRSGELDRIYQRYQRDH